MFRFLFYLTMLTLAGCAATPRATTASNMLDPSIIPGVQAAFDDTSNKEYAAALDILNNIIESKGDVLKPYDLATVLELRGVVKKGLRDYDGALADYKKALALNAFPADRRQKLEQFIAQLETGEIQTQDGVRQPVVRVSRKFPEQCINEDEPYQEEFVSLEFDVTEDGAVENVNVVEASDNCFIEAAVTAVSKWKYVPLLKNGKPIRMPNQTAQITFSYAGEP